MRKFFFSIVIFLLSLEKKIIFQLNLIKNIFFEIVYQVLGFNQIKKLKSAHTHLTSTKFFQRPSLENKEIAIFIAAHIKR